RELQLVVELGVDDVEAPEGEEDVHLDALAERGVAHDERGVGHVEVALGADEGHLPRPGVCGGPALRGGAGLRGTRPRHTVSEVRHYEALGDGSADAGPTWQSGDGLFGDGHGDS